MRSGEYTKCHCFYRPSCKKVWSPSARALPRNTFPTPKLSPRHFLLACQWEVLSATNAKRYAELTNGSRLRIRFVAVTLRSVGRVSSGMRMQKCLRYRLEKLGNSGKNLEPSFNLRKTPHKILLLRVKSKLYFSKRAVIASADFYVFEFYSRHSRRVG